jgi:small subunit ribosomal protein S11
MTDPAGNTVAWCSAGMMGFKGSRKGTPFAAQVTAEEAAKKAMDAGMRSIDVYLKGPGAGREPAIRALAGLGMRILSLKDITPVPHNGCRPPKRRRI